MTDIVLEKIKQFVSDLICYGKESVNMTVLNNLIEIADNATCETLKTILMNLKKALDNDDAGSIAENVSLLDFYF